jgi:hypothetical protein
MPDHEPENAVESPEASGSTPAGGASAVAQQDEQEPTLAEKLVVESSEPVGDISPDVGETKPDPGAGGSRFDELVAKRKATGLSDEESEELGRLMAQRDGREWTSTREMRTQPADRT